MTELIVPATIASQLQAVPCPVNLCDASGKTLGCFVPAIDPQLFEIVGAEPTQEELNRVERSGKWHSTADVLQHLEKLA